MDDLIWILVMVGLLAATLGLSAVFGLMACTDMTRNFPLLLACCVLLSAMSAVYGCAMLGLSCIVLPHRERGFGGVIQTMAARGGKMIIVHGWADALVSPAMTADWFEKMRAAMGGRDATNDFAQLYVVPGMVHGSGGNAPPSSRSGA